MAERSSTAAGHRGLAKQEPNGLANHAANRPVLPAVAKGCSAGDDHRGITRQESNVDTKQIRKDLPRTFPEQPAVQSCAAQVESVLREYAAADPELGYCQGMNCVAAVVVVCLGSDMVAATASFGRFLSRMRGLWLSGFPLLHLGAAAFEALRKAHLPELCVYFEKRGMTSEMFTTGILACEWLSLFSRWLPFTALWGAFEFVEAEGLPGLLGLTVALLQAHMPALVEASDFMDLFVLLKDLRGQPQQPELAKVLVAAQDLLPAAHQAIHEAESAGSRAGFSSNASISRSGSRVVHNTADLELVVFAEDAKSAMVNLAKGLQAVCDTVLETVTETLATSTSNNSLDRRNSMRKLPLCRCFRPRARDDD